VKTLFNSLTGKKIALFGFAFKKNTGDTRESAAIKLVKSFLLEGGRVDIFDPKVTEEQVWHELVSPDTTRECCIDLFSYAVNISTITGQSSQIPI
jgi:UDPglucose 6-dehydrogenase